MRGYGCPLDDNEEGWTVDRWSWQAPDTIELRRGDADSEANQITASLTKR